MEFVPGKSKLFCMEGVPKLWPMTSLWTDKDVHDFICDVGYGKYAQCFRDNAVNGKSLLSITPFELQRIGVKSMRDALHLHATIRATANRMRFNKEDPDNPPNISYSSVTKGHILHNPKLPPNLQPERSAAFSSDMPPLPGHPYDIDWKILCLPFRRDTDSMFDKTPRRPYRPKDDTCPRTDDKDKFTLYNSRF